MRFFTVKVRNASGEKMMWIHIRTSSGTRSARACRRPTARCRTVAAVEHEVGRLIAPDEPAEERRVREQVEHDAVAGRSRHFARIDARDEVDRRARRDPAAAGRGPGSRSSVSIEVTMIDCTPSRRSGQSSFSVAS